MDYAFEPRPSESHTDDLFGLAPEAPQRISTIAFCDRCDCRLSQYRDPKDRMCCACARALNPLFEKSA